MNPRYGFAKPTALAMIRLAIIDLAHGLTVLVLASALSACGGGGGGDPSPDPPESHSVSATVTGLVGSGLVLKMSAQKLVVTADGKATFPTPLPTGSAYAVTVETGPARPSQTCTIDNGTGTVQRADVVNVNVNCTTAGTAPTSTWVSIDSKLQAAVTPVIATIVSPLQSGSADSWIDISTATPTQKSLILALNINGELVMGAVTDDHATQLSAASTAQALVILALDDLATSNLDATIGKMMATPGYADMVATIESALNASRSPIADPAIIEQILTVTGQTADALAPAVSSTSPATKVSLPHLSSPFVLVYDTVASGNALELSSSQLINRTPLKWEFSTWNVAGAPLSTGETIQGRRGVLAVSQPFVRDTRGTSIRVSQTPGTRADAFAEVIVLSLEGVLEFVPVGSCTTTGLALDVLDYIRPKAAAIKSFGPLYDAIIEMFSDPITYPTLFKDCAEDQVLEIAESVHIFFKAISFAKGAYKVGTAAAVVVYLNEYWDTDRPFGLCFNGSGAMINCATRLAFEPPSIEIAPGGGRGELKWFAYDGVNAVAAQGGIECSSGTPLLTVDPSTCRVASDSATFKAGGPYDIKLEDPATGITATGKVNVVIPIITPDHATIHPNDGVMLWLRSPSGNILELPPGVTWSSDDPSGAHLSYLANPDAAQASLWSNKAPQTPGVVTVFAKYANGVEFARATITIEDEIGELIVYGVYGGPLSPIATPYTSTTVTTSDSGTTTDTFTQEAYHLVANFHGAPGSPLGYSICKRGDTWIDANYSVSYDSPISPLRAECSGTPFQDHWRANVSAFGGTLHATMAVDSGASLACDDSVGFVVNRSSSSSTSHQVTNYTINLETGVGSGTFTVNQSSNYSTTSSIAGGGLQTSTMSSTTSGNAGGSWSPADPSDPLNGTRITKRKVALAPDDPLPAYCTSR